MKSYILILKSLSAIIIALAVRKMLRAQNSQFLFWDINPLCENCKSRKIAYYAESKTQQRMRVNLRIDLSYDPCVAFEGTPRWLRSILVRISRILSSMSRSSKSLRANMIDCCGLHFSHKYCVIKYNSVLLTYSFYGKTITLMSLTILNDILCIIILLRQYIYIFFFSFD